MDHYCLISGPKLLSQSLLKPLLGPLLSVVLGELRLGKTSFLSAKIKYVHICASLCHCCRILGLVVQRGKCSNFLYVRKKSKEAEAMTMPSLEQHLLSLHPSFMKQMVEKRLHSKALSRLVCIWESTPAVPEHAERVWLWIPMCNHKA